MDGIAPSKIILVSPDTSFNECVLMCEKKRASDDQWNGMVWRSTTRLCACVKNDKGHDTSYLDCLHFTTEQYDDVKV